MPKRFAGIKPRPRPRNIIVVLSMTADNAACEAIRSKVIVFYDFECVHSFYISSVNMYTLGLIYICQQNVSWQHSSSMNAVLL